MVSFLLLFLLKSESDNFYSQDLVFGYVFLASPSLANFAQPKLIFVLLRVCTVRSTGKRSTHPEWSCRRGYIVDTAHRQCKSGFLFDFRSREGYFAHIVVD